MLRLNASLPLDKCMFLYLSYVTNELAENQVSPFSPDTQIGKSQ